MGKGDVTLKFDAEDAVFVQKVLKMRQELQAAANDSRKFAEDVGKAGDKTLNTITSIAGGIGVFTTASEVASAGVRVVMGTLENYMQRIEDRAAGLLSRVQTLNQAAGGAGQIGAVAGLRRDIRNLSGERFGPNGVQLSEKELTNAAAGIYGDLGARATPENAIKGAETFGHATAAGMGVDAAQRTANNFARLARYRDQKEGFQGLSDEQLRDFAYSASVYKPDMSDKDWRFVARSKDKTQALQVLFAAGQSDENAKALMQIQEKSQGDPERLQQFLQHPETAPEKQRLALQNLARGAKESPVLSLSTAEKAFAGSDEESHLATVDRQAKSFHEQTEEEGATEDLRHEEVKRLRREIFRSRHPLQDYIPGAEKLSGVLPTVEEDAYSATEKNSVRLSSGESLEVLQGILQELQSGNKGDQTRDRTGLKTDLPGQH